MSYNPPYYIFGPNGQSSPNQHTPSNPHHQGYPMQQGLPTLQRVLRIDLSKFCWGVDPNSNAAPYFISNDYLNGAKEGDLVLIQPIPRKDGNLMARVLKVLESSYSKQPKPQNNDVNYNNPNVNYHQGKHDSYSQPQYGHYTPHNTSPIMNENSQQIIDSDTLINYKASTNLTDRLKTYIHHVFLNNSRAKPGCLTLEELNESLDVLGHDRVFVNSILRSFNASEEGIFESQFCSTMAHMVEDNNEKRRIISFRFFDVYNEGKLSKKGVFYVIKSVYSTLVNMRLPVYENDIKKYVDDLWSLISPKEAEKVSLDEYIIVYPSLVQHLRTIGFINPIEFPLYYYQSGVPVIFGSPNFPLVMQLVMGIRLTTYNLGPVTQLEDFDFAYIDKYDLTTSIYSDRKCIFTSYAPRAFKTIRHMSGIEEASFVQQFCPEHMVGNMLLGIMAPLRSTISAGASGAKFFMSDDRRFIAKTISNEERNCALMILKDYCAYLSQNKDSLLCRLFGLYSINNINVLVMGNTLHSKYPMDEIYDLKGSTVGRQSDGPIKKDLNFNRTVYIGAQRQRLLNQINLDTQFLQKMNICDYSMLVGLRKQIHTIEFSDSNPVIVEYSGHTPFWATEYGGIRVLNSQMQPTNEIMHIGTIDILTQYGLTKKAERFIKSLVHEKKGISAANPSEYRDRFIQYMQAVFK